MIRRTCNLEDDDSGEDDDLVDDHNSTMVEVNFLLKQNFPLQLTTC